MYKTTLLIAFVCFCFLTSCRSKRQESQKVDTTIETTKESIVSYKDTIVYAPKSETSLKIPVSDLSFKPDLNNLQKPKVFTQKNGNATAKIEIVPDGIVITATCDSLAIAAKIKSKLEKEYRLKEKADQSKTDIKTGYTLFDLFVALLVGFIIGLALKFFKIV
ncbi:hypothetical protein NJT12_03330 [Flavobacterium sp. AC]|uniref:Uncharacterized protein n=1 Tax=Flavobacterium azizsancarii TaxID=2961580 RepID=A0ABT4W7Y0_9FLAO|nr:hypothetical protein [Flavobacterium azizsancarii]MDA6068643.1 hypothetical protein [Flavobacterium azizsancarii]